MTPAPRAGQEAASRSLAGEASRDKILETSEALFARSGFAGVGMREVARDVGLSKSALFHHFPTKLELYSEVLGRVLGRLSDRLQPALDRAGDPGERLDACVDALIDFLAEDPSTARLAMRSVFEDDPFVGAALDEREPEPFETLLLELIGRFQTLLERGIASGRLRRVSVPDTIQSIIGMTVYHFASGEFGEALFGGSLYSSPAIARRRREVKGFVRRALLREPAATEVSGEAPG
jgi:AcrR family transcriptional regulator